MTFTSRGHSLEFVKLKYTFVIKKKTQEHAKEDTQMTLMRLEYKILILNGLEEVV